MAVIVAVVAVGLVVALGRGIAIVVAFAVVFVVVVSAVGAERTSAVAVAAVIVIESPVHSHFLSAVTSQSEVESVPVSTPVH